MKHKQQPKLNEQKMIIIIFAEQNNYKTQTKTKDNKPAKKKVTVN